jgi:trehalose synthase
MSKLHEAQIPGLPPARLAAVIGPERAAYFDAVAGRARNLLAGRTLLNVNSTATGGGVAEMLQALLAYVRGAGIDAQWVILAGNPAFFAVTKRIHNAIHGAPGDGGPLGDREREIYDEVMRDNVHEMLTLVRPGDVVLLHDPQTAGLIDALKHAGAVVLWRCHIGSDEPNEWSDRAWAFLEPYLAKADAYVFTREVYAPRWMDRARLHVIAPSLDPFSPKNEEMPRERIHQILGYVGIIDGIRATTTVPFVRRDGTAARLDRHADVLQTGPPPPIDVPLVVQVSRWDRLKDMQGVMEAFAAGIEAMADAHLLLAGPNVTGVTDDPEGAEVLDECISAWRSLAHAARSRIHLACLPTADVDENAVIVNAIQRHAAVVTQKSLAEGFGLTVAEAMWKSRPVVATRVGGIGDQIVHGESGLLVDDPTDHHAFAGAIERLLADPREAARIGANARERTANVFLGDRHLCQYADLLERLLRAA